MATRLTEDACIDFLLQVARDCGETSPRCIVVNRIMGKRTIKRNVKIALVATTNNLKLVDTLIYKCLDFSDDLVFIGSEINLQSDLEIEYLYFEASIFPNSTYKV